jgi:carboxypeptidase Taq
MYQKFVEKMSELADVQYAIAVLGWDQEVYMPEKGADKRGQQIATLSGISHNLATSEELGQIISSLLSDTSLTPTQKSNVDIAWKLYNKSKKFTTEFVTKKSKAISEAFAAWDKAKNAKDFSIYLPFLEKIVNITRQETEILGYKDHPYNALIDQYEPDMTVAELDVLFEDVKKGLKPLLDHINSFPIHDDSILLQKFDKQKQTDLGEDILVRFGYDMTGGRQDISSHPFCTSFSSEDVRVTTRVDENDLANSVWSTIHECGHALYEQGLPADQYGLASGTAMSLGIHESQSRFWENNIGRSKEFVTSFLPVFQKYFPDQLNTISDEQFYKSINVVKPSLIRTESDELTYHFHIMIRYEIEKDLVSGKLAVKDVRDVWNEKYKSYLGIDVPDDASGVLQDVHWAHGGIGYFPTYSLGSFFAAQWWHFIQQEIPSIKEDVLKGDTTKILEWLRKNIHSMGSQYSPQILCEKVTGEKLNFKYFMEYANNKFKDIYK